MSSVDVQSPFIEQPQARELDDSIEQFRSALMTYCTGICGSSDTGEDIVQETLIRALPVLTGYVTHPNVKAYLFRIVKCVWLDIVKKRKSEQNALCHIDGATAHDDATVLRMADLDAALTTLFQSLTPLQRTVFLLRDVFCYRASEVSTMLGMNEGSVKAALHRARYRLENGTDEVVHEDALVGNDVPKLVEQYAEAIERGDVARLIRLGRMERVNVFETEMALRVVRQKETQRQKNMRHSSISSRTMCMAA